MIDRAGNNVVDAPPKLRRQKRAVDSQVANQLLSRFEANVAPGPQRFEFGGNFLLRTATNRRDSGEEDTLALGRLLGGQRRGSSGLRGHGLVVGLKTGLRSPIMRMQIEQSHR